MLSIALWSLCAIALVVCGWLASARFHQRQIGALRQQVKAARQTAADHASQVRRQIAQLQAEIESHKAAAAARRATVEPKPVRTPRAASGEAVRSVVADADLVPAAGFAQTTIVPRDGFASTEVMA